MLRKALVVLAIVNLAAASVASSQELNSVEDSLAELQKNYFSEQAEGDLNGDGVVDFLDLGVLRSRLGLPDPISARSGLGAFVTAPGTNVLFFSLFGESSIVEQVSVIDQDQLFLDLNMSFFDTTVGGGIDLAFDAAVLSLVDVAFDDALGDDPNFRCPTDPAATNPIDCSGNGPNFLSFGSISGITGDNVVATIEFDAIATGSSSIGFTIARTFSDTSGQPIEVLPEPHLSWLAALAALGVLNERRRVVSKHALGA